jgi:nickel/cobalt transporter (NicO) family protein
MIRVLLVVCAGLAAHPMGNFSVNHYTAIEVGRSSVAVTYILDLGEVPAYTVLKDGKTADQLAREWMRGLEFRSGEVVLDPRLVSAEMKSSEGSGGLRTLRVSSRMVLDGVGLLRFEDHNFPDRSGWKEILIRAGPGVAIVRASQGSKDRSSALTDYREYREHREYVPQDLRARVEWSPGDSKIAPVIVPIDQPAPVTQDAREAATAATPASAAPAKKDYLEELLGHKDIGVGVMLAGLAVAFGLGAMHALSPGHGKTIVAAYLVGSRGTMRHAAILGATVTFTHTASVFALGLATLFLSEYVAPQKIAPVLGAVSGISIVAIGVWLGWKRWGAVRHERAHRLGHHHHHQHGSDVAVLKKGTNRSVHSAVLKKGTDRSVHSAAVPPEGAMRSGDRVVSPLFQREAVAPEGVVGPLFQHEHDGHSHSHVPEGDITMGSLLALGASGGLAPCPSALVLLLSSIALGHVALGMTLLVAFSLGLAGVLMGIGMMVLYAKQWLPDPAATARHPVLRWAPVGSAAVIVGVGLVMTWVALRVALRGSGI